jgi:hypothetical protein
MAAQPQLGYIPSGSLGLIFVVLLVLLLLGKI